MSEQIKRWNVPRGTTVSESPHGEFYHCADFDTLAQRLQEAESALEMFINLGVTPGGWVELDDALSCAAKVLAGKGDKP